MLAAAIAGGAVAALRRRNSSSSTATESSSDDSDGEGSPSVSIWELDRFRQNQTLKRRDWTRFQQYLRTHSSTLSLAGCSGAVVVDFLRYMDGLGERKVHAATCGNFGTSCRTVLRCDCPNRQHWTTLLDLVGRLRVAFVENGGNPASNPFNALDVDNYLDDSMSSQIRWR